MNEKPCPLVELHELLELVRVEAGKRLDANQARLDELLKRIMESKTARKP